MTASKTIKSSLTEKEQLTEVHIIADTELPQSYVSRALTDQWRNVTSDPDARVLVTPAKPYLDRRSRFERTAYLAPTAESLELGQDTIRDSLGVPFTEWGDGMGLRTHGVKELGAQEVGDLVSECEWDERKTGYEGGVTGCEMTVMMITQGMVLMMRITLSDGAAAEPSEA